MKHSKIAWTEHTWNPVTGCTQVPGPQGRPSGCDNCYAKRLNDTRMVVNPKSPRFGVPFETVLLHRDRLDQPLRWKTPARIFVNSLSDLFHADVPDAFISEVFWKMDLARQHTFQILTKRPERMRRFATALHENLTLLAGHEEFDVRTPLPNVWLGVSISTGDDAWRASMLAKTPAAVRFLSLEPLLGPIPPEVIALADWVIVGGESGPGARDLDERWVRDIVVACRDAGVPVFVKQLGSVWAARHGLKGKAEDPAAWPRDLQVREYPDDDQTLKPDSQCA